MDESTAEFERLRRLMTGSCVRPLVHEVNNLLGAAMAYTELAQMEAEGAPKTKRQLGEAMGALQRCSQLVNVFAQVVRPIRQSAFNLQDIARAALDLRMYALRAQSVAVDFQTPEEPVQSQGVAAMTQYALLCLMMECERRLSSVPSGRSLQVSVTSTSAGAGLRLAANAPAAAGHAFEASRLTSLGLDLPELDVESARRFIEAQGGNLVVQPETSFLVMLPAATPA
ncbi:MAG: hypothetical protein RLZZ303_3473 [Candidatus Hydrogenedentota bacterium]